jgi:hypothetical protein
MQLNPIFWIDGTTHATQGKGSVHFSLPRMGKILLSNVWYVPTFQKNLFFLLVIKQGYHKIIMEKWIHKNQFNEEQLQNNDEWL